MGFFAHPGGPSIISLDRKASRLLAAPQPRIGTLRMKTSQRSLKGQGWDVVFTCKAENRQAFPVLGPVSPTGTRAGRPEEQGGGCQKSSQLLFHLLALFHGPLGAQATPPFSVSGSSFHPGGTLSTAHAVTGRTHSFPGSPPCPTSSGEEESLEIKQANTQSQPHPKLVPWSLKSPAPWTAGCGVTGVGHSPCPALGFGIALLKGGWEWGWLTPESAASADTRSPRAK